MFTPARGHVCSDIVKIVFVKGKLWGEILYKTEYLARRLVDPLWDMIPIY